MGSGRIFDFCYGSGLKIQSLTKIKGVIAPFSFYSGVNALRSE